jgi:putative SOS response-associated peptidase YedK
MKRSVPRGVLGQHMDWLDITVGTVQQYSASASGRVLETCTILTTTANALTAPVHDRMPVILDPRCYDLWLDPGTMDTTTISEFFKPFDARPMSCFPVSSRVNRPTTMTHNAQHR